MGNRVCKIEKPYNLTSTGWKYTFYVRDASGNIMTTYTKTGSEIENNVLKLDEVILYGSSRIGTREVNTLLSGLTVPTTTFSRSLGLKRYEVSNHLGNVLATFTDRKYQIQSSNQVIGYKTYIASSQDYYPFGMIMNGRNWNTSGYRFGFNGKEKDDETYGDNNEYDFGARIYNPRIGRFLSVDPLTNSFAGWSPYAYAFDNPTGLIDENGMSGTSPHEKFYRDYAAPLIKTLDEKSVANKFKALYIVAQKRAESGYKLSGYNGNIYNITGRGDNGSVAITAKEEINGKIVMVTQNYAVYSSNDKASEAYLSLIQKGYSSSWSALTDDSKTIDDFVEGLSRYATSSNYADLIKQCFVSSVRQYEESLTTQISEIDKELKKYSGIKSQVNPSKEDAAEYNEYGALLAKKNSLTRDLSDLQDFKKKEGIVDPPQKKKR